MQQPDRFDAAEGWLHEAAMARCGLRDFGSPDYLDGLRCLLASLQDDLPRDAVLREACLAPIVGTLVARLYSEEGWRRHPECFDRAIERPVFIVGAPRTGTTALHQMLAADPAWQGLDSWLTKTPRPRPPREQWCEFAEFRDAWAAHEARLGAFPEFRAIHAVAPDEVDECIHVTQQTMISNTFGSIMHVPAYDSWFRQQDFRPAFRRLDHVLRLIGMHERDRRWLLKNPSHVLDLDKLLESFPNCRVIYIHRDPVKSQPSLWSLLEVHRRSRDGAQISLPAIARREIALYAPALERNISLAAQHPDRILEVRQDELIADPVHLAEKVYQFAEQKMNDAAIAAIRSWLARNVKDQHGIHRYHAGDFGVSADELAERFAAYRAHYGFADAA